MGKQKDFRHVHHPSNKKKDKKFDKTAKHTRTSSQVGFLKNAEGVVQAELESVAHSKKIGRKICKELERYPLLAKAVFLGCERIVDNILEADEDVNVTVSDGSTPLIIAVENGHTSIVQKLLKKGADPKLLRQDGRNALMIAVSKNDNRSFTLIWNYWDKNSFWELNHSDSQGYTALTIAAEHGHSQFIKFFLSLNGIEIDKQTADGATPLMLAVFRGHDSVAKKLIASGSDIMLEDKSGATALCLAISRNRAEIKNLMTESLDMKSRNAYVKKRTELLTRPRLEDTSAVIAFSKDVLFPVILEIRRSFQEGLLLLEKYQIFNNLLRCMNTHQQDMQFLKVAFHLSACLIYDKAEYSRYIVEKLAEQYIQAKGLDFSLKVITNRRIRSFTGARGAAFLPVHACSQCASGIIWLKANYSQLHPFVKEFKVIFPTLEFWANGENVKAQILFDRFGEIFKTIEKDLKTLRSEPSERNIPTYETTKQPENAPADESILHSSTSDQQGWHLVSNAKSGSNRSTSMPKNARTSKASATKKKRKVIKLQTKIQRKSAGKKNLQRVNNKFLTCSSFPALAPEKKFSGTGYADALKKNLTDEVSPEKYEEVKTDVTGSTVSSKLSSDKDCWPNISLCALFDNSKKDETEVQIENLKKSPSERKNIVDEQGLNLVSFQNEDRKKMEELCDLWTKVSCSENPVDTMTTLMKMFKSHKTNTKPQELKRGMTVSERLLSSQEAKDGHLNDLDTKLKISNETLCCKDADLGSEAPVIQNYIKMTNYIDYSCDDQALENLEEKCLRGSSLKTDISTVSSADEKDLIHKASDLLKEETHNISQSSDLDTTFESQSSSDMNYSKHSSEIQIISFSSTENVGEVGNSSDARQSYKRKSIENNRQDLCYNFLREEVKENVQSHLSLDQLIGSKGYFSSNFNILQTEKKDTSGASTDKNASAGRSFPINEEFNPESVNLKYDSEANIFPSENHSELKHEKVISAASDGTNFCDISKKISGEFSLLSDFSFEFERSKKFDQFSVDGICNYNTSSKISVLHFIIDGKFSDLIPGSHKNKLNSKFLFRVPPLLPFNTFLFTSKVKLENLQKRVIMYQRTIFHKITTWMRMNNSCKSILPTENLSVSIGSFSSYDEESENEAKECLSNPASGHSSRLETLAPNNYLTNKKECNILRFKRKHTLLQMKMEVGKHKNALQSIEGTLKLSKSDCTSNLKNIKPTDKRKSMNTIPMKLSGLEPKREIWGSSNTEHFFTNSKCGYKPQFINCESTSRWYRILGRIESCVPLASLLLDPTDVKSLHRESFLHELIYPCGKIVFSTKEEHTLRQGYFGTFLGLLSNGIPVVVREFPKSSYDAVMLLTKKRRANHRNIAAFYCVSDSPLDKKLFAVTELCEFSLHEYLKEGMGLKDKIFLIQNLVEAVRYLHERKIVHGFLKPSNVMLTIDHTLKVTDYYRLDISPLVYGVVRREEYEAPTPIGNYFTDYSWRPFELIAAATKTEARQYLASASDVQMTGMLIYYILSGGKHPFGFTDRQCQENILSGRPELGPKPKDIESRGLVRDMIRRVPSTRPTMNVVMKHPYFWNANKRFQFLIAVARKIEFYSRKPTKIFEDLQDSCLEARAWTCRIHYELLKYISESMSRVYRNDFVDLLQFMVGVQDNFEIMPHDFKTFIQEPSFFFLKTFPTIFMSVYSVIRDNPVVQRQLTLEVYF